MFRLPAVAIVLVASLAGCAPSAGDRFHGRWRSDRGADELSIGGRGLGSGHVLFLRNDRRFTWKLADSDRIMMEFGESTTTRRTLEGQIRDDDTLLVTHLKSSTILRRVPTDAPAAGR